MKGTPAGRDDSELVWSSDQGDLRKDDGFGKSARPSGPRRGGSKGGGGEVERRPKAAPGTPLKVRREVAGRRGKAVTSISDIPLSDAELKKLAATLKKKCGVGGTAKGGRIEIQGDHREKVIKLLEGEGYAAIAAGG